jgi:surfactin family lipopeptide synthetase A
MNSSNLDRGALEIVHTRVQSTNRKSLSSEEWVEDDLSFWRQKLAGIPAILGLPTDRPRPPVQTLCAARESTVFSTDLKARLMAVCKQEKVSFFVLLLAAFQTLLMRYTRQNDIVLGIMTREAHEDEVRRLNDGFAATIPIRTDLSGDITFRQLLSRADEEVSAAWEHRHVAWDRLVETLQPDRDASYHPLFQVLFSVEDSQFSFEQTVRPLKVDLQLQMQDHLDGFAAHFTYASDLFDAATIARMEKHFGKLLEGIAENSGETLWKLPLLTEAERYRLVVEWNNTAMDYARDRCVHQLFEAQAVRTPNATAVVFGKESLTYGELDRRANQLAHHLIRLGASPDGLVAICLDRSLEMVIGLLAILKAGAAYVPLDPAYPRDRIAFMLENAEVPLLLTQAPLRENLPSTSAVTVLIDSDWVEIAKQSQESPVLTLSPENRAYVIYTSGSTGRPKGVEIPHRAVVNFLTTMADRPGMNTTDRLLAVTTLSFDIAGLEIYLPLTQGASVEIVSREVASDGNQLLEKLAGSDATVMQATPATWRMLLEAGWTGDAGLKILIGGEAVSHKLANQLLQRSASVWNVYGPTETTIWSTLSKIEPGENVTIGRPIGNTEIFILDKMLQPVPIGVAGELHIGGDGLARGYLKRPELTSEKFIPHPLSPDPKARLYKTGDLVRYLPEGNIEFLGRIDQQVKIRGFRIELGEIEATLRQHPRIIEPVVVAREDTPGDQRVVAYFVPTGGAPTTAELRSFLREKLPEYMLPSVFVMLKSMPLTPNGKVDRRALPAPSQADLAPRGTTDAPKDATESQLVQIWENILGVRPIGVRDNYFELGGHSLLAVKLMNRIEESFGKTLPIATLLQAPTIEQLAAILRRKGWAPPWSCLVPIQSGGSKPPFFCIHGINGAVVRFHDLSRYLGTDQPFYGLQAQGLDAAHPCHTRTEDMASHYIEEIRKVQPRGPYFLGGYSFGGAIAFEIAQQLAAQGHEDSLVILFDTNFPQQKKSISVKAASTSSVFLTFFRIPASQRLRYFWRVVRAPFKPIQWWLHVAKLPPLVKKVRKACLQAERDYMPQPYSGRVILFRSDHMPLGQVIDPRAGWSECVTRGLEVCEITGNHENILLEPQVRFVAQHLKTFLDEACVATHASFAHSSELEKTVQ